MVKVTRLVAALMGLSLGTTGCLPTEKKAETARGPAPAVVEPSPSRAPERAPAPPAAGTATVSADDAAPGSPGLARVRVIKNPSAPSAPLKAEEIDPRAFESRVPPMWTTRAGPHWQRAPQQVEPQQPKLEKVEQ